MEAIKIPIYECKVGKMDNTGIFAMSFVEYPAIEKNFIALKRASVRQLHLNRQKQILTGAVIIPDQLIYRYDESQGEYYIKFTADDIEKISLKMMKTGIALSGTTHEHDKRLKGNYLAELWIVRDSKTDKSVALGLGEMPVGTLMVSYKVEDANYWQSEVMTGKVKGFSLEGIFNFNSVNMKKTTTAAKKAAPKLSKFGLALKAVGINVLLEDDTAAAAKDLATVATDDEVDAGEPVLIFDLADGTELLVDSDGYATIDGEQAPAGEHQLADGNFIVIDDSGNLVVTQEEGGDNPDAAPDTALSAEKKEAAKARAKEFMKKTVTPDKAKKAEVAKLKARIAELEKEPSTEKAKPGTQATVKAFKDMKPHERMAAAVRARNEARTAK